MTATPATLIPLYIQRVRECVKIEDESVRHKTWASLAKHVSVLLKQSKNSEFLDSVLPEEDSEAFRELVGLYPPKPTAPHLVARPESSKLSEYASVATLPPMPWTPQARKSSTERSPTKERNLRSVQQISTTEFLGRVLSYQKAKPPSGANGFPEELRVPHDSYPFVQSAGCVTSESEEHVAAWVRQVALGTALCLLHDTETESNNCKFGKATSKQGLSDVVFKRPKSARLDEKKLLVEVKCPWTLPLKDMEQITKLYNGLPSVSELEAADDDGGKSSSSSNPPSPGKGTKPGYTTAQRVLAQVYDYCQEQKHHFFIITTYEHWMFGVFSLDYGSVAVTEPLPYDHKGPTILQCITYWLQSSLFLPGSFEVPEVSAVPDHAGPSSPLTTGNMWKRTLRRWRKDSITDLKLDTQLAEHIEAKKLMDMCCNSLTELDPPPTSPTSRNAHLSSRCDTVMEHIQHPPNGQPEWTVILTWLALALDPIALHDDLQSLEAAFVVAADLDRNHPIHKDQVHAKRKSFVDSRRARGESAGMLRRNHSWEEGGTLPEFYWRYASKDAATILDLYQHSSPAAGMASPSDPYD